MKNNLNNNSEAIESKKIDWMIIQKEMKVNFGSDIYESWLKKIDFIEEFQNYILISVSTRFIRDWITSRYLDQILKIIKTYKKEINRIEFTISNNLKLNEAESKFDDQKIENNNISFLKDSHLQYSRIDPNKNFDNFIIGSSNKLAFEASKKVSDDISSYNPLYIYGGVGLGKTHLLNSIGLKLKDKNKVMFI